MNFSFYRVKAIILRNILQFKNNLFVAFEVFYWPLLDILLWGMTSVWLAQHNNNISLLALIIMSALVLWELCVRATYEIGVSMIREIYSRTLLDLFSTPLTISEWLVGLMITGLIRMFVSLIFCTGVVWLLYALNIFSLGCSMVLLIIPLIIFGWTTGFLCAGFIIYFGQKVESLPWMALFLFAPFSAVYYPITVLPYWMQVVAYCLPSSYVFETLRLLISTHQFSYSNYLISLVLGSIYLTLSIIFFYYMFCKSKKLGLARL